MQQILKTRTYPCPVCAYGLDTPAANFTICPSCGVEFGYSDIGVTHKELRREWIQFNAPWTSSVIRKPFYWNPWVQLIEGGYSADIPWLNNLTVTQETIYVPVKLFIDPGVRQIVEFGVPA